MKSSSPLNNGFLLRTPCWSRSPPSQIEGPVPGRCVLRRFCLMVNKKEARSGVGVAKRCRFYPRVLLSRRYWSPQCVCWRAGPAACLLTGTQTLQNSLLRDAQQTRVLPRIRMRRRCTRRRLTRSGDETPLRAEPSAPAASARLRASRPALPLPRTKKAARGH